MNPKTLSRPWLAHSIRLTVFPVAPWEAPANLWQSVVGEAPETDQNQAKQLVRAQAGQWQSSQLQVVATPLRIDWTASPAMRTDTDGTLGPDHRPMTEVFPLFVDATRSWLISTDCEVKRIAFGVQGLLPGGDRIAAYRLLQELLPHIPIQPETSSDFIYQINHPVQSRALDIKLNRITKWSGLAFRFVMVQEGAGAQSASVPIENFASLECDHNTPAEGQDRLDSKPLGLIYAELAQLAWENLEVGEVR